MTEAEERGPRPVEAGSIHVVIGCNGPVGTELMHQLSAQGKKVRGVCRSGKSKEAPEGAEIIAGDIAVSEQTAPLCRGAGVVYSCVGVDYSEWMEQWPWIVNGLIDAAGTSGAKLIFADNLYSYGPHDGPLTEDLPLTRYGRKPAFDQPHTYTYVPDFARALIRVGEDDSALNQIWHVPSAPARTTRQVVETIFKLAGQRPRMRVMPNWLLTAMGSFNPLLGEFREMSFIWDRPYILNHDKFVQHFGDDWTPLDEGLETTLDWYRESS
jgi:nucleoside-diphosphate-sugar epimerase